MPSKISVRNPRGRTLFIMTSDHGHIHTPILERYDLTRYEDINRHLVMVPTGENRLPYLIPRTGSEHLVIDLIHQHFGEDFIPVASKHAIKSGLFGYGKHHPMLADRLGDWILNSPERCLSMVVVAKRKPVAWQTWRFISAGNADSIFCSRALILDRIRYSITAVCIEVICIEC